MSVDFLLRNIEEDDYDRIIPLVDHWWGGRKVADKLPRWFFIHFSSTSWVVEDQGEPVAFICGFISPSRPGQAYIHFIGVHPDYRHQGLASRLYWRFFAASARSGCREVHSLTSPVNLGSIAFHRRMGFEVRPGGREANGVPVAVDYNGPGEDRVLFMKRL